MKLEGYLVVKRWKQGAWPKLSARFLATKPALENNEISIKIEAELPDELFTKPQLVFKLDVPKEAVSKQEITADVQGNIKDLIQSNLGIGVTLVVENKNEEQ